MKKAIVLVGMSGSGKSTHARNLVSQLGRGIVLSTDDFFMVDGKYCFDGSKLGLYHAQNLFKFIECCRSEYEVVICDNTNTTMAELAQYVGPATAYGYDVEVHFVNCDPVLAAGRNNHGVPLKAVEAMAKRIEQLKQQMPPWWTVKHIG